MCELYVTCGPWLLDQYNLGCTLKKFEIPRNFLDYRVYMGSSMQISGLAIDFILELL
jgi:hypothetical protein